MVTRPGNVSPAEFEVATKAVVVLAGALDELERARIATESRARAFVEEKGGEDHPLGERLQGLTDSLKMLEHQAVLDLKRAFRKHPLHPWISATPGLGEKQTARLLARLGNPADRPNPGKLFAYCGFVPGMKLSKGQQANFNPIAKARTHLIAESCIKLMGTGNKPCSPYRAVYDKARANWADHDKTDAHKHNHALRKVSMAILLDLWRESRKLQGLSYNKNRA